MTGVPSWAVRGAKVVCIDAARPDEIASDCVTSLLPQKGSVYTIDWVTVEADGHVWLGLSELDPEVAYGIRYFAPVVTRSLEQDMFVHFSQHLRTDQRVPEKA